MNGTPRFGVPGFPSAGGTYTIPSASPCAKHHYGTQPTSRVLVLNDLLLIARRTNPRLNTFRATEDSYNLTTDTLPALL